MNSISTLTVIAGLCATGSSLLVLRHGPSRRLRLMVLTSGLVSLSQTATLLHILGIWGSGETYAIYLHQLLVAMLSMMSIYLLATESRDRKAADVRLRLAEHELMHAKPAMADMTAATQSSVDCVSLLKEVRRADGRSREVCAHCVEAAQEIAEAWNKITDALAHHGGPTDTGTELGRAKLELAAALRKRWLHESEASHDVLDPREQLLRQ